MFSDRLTRNSVALALCFSAVTVPTFAAEIPVTPANDAKLIFEVRWRIESVDDAAFTKNALADTIRMRLGFRTPVFHGLSAVAILEQTSFLFDDNFDSTANGNVTYPVVADPNNTAIDQAYLQYARNNTSKFILGRQTIIYDNQRFFGNSGWRQNEQTFDGFDAQHHFDSGLNIRYSYLDRVQRVFGEDNPNKDLAYWQLSANLFSANYRLGPGTLTGYAYFIDNQTLPLTSQQDFGLRYVAKHDSPDGIGWLANLEYAQQSDYADGSALIDADYTMFEGGLIWKANTFTARWEQLGGDGRYGFATPYATLHAFDGWADRFLKTPVNGVQDASIAWNRKWGKLVANIIWHDFHSDHLNLHYGQEWDASLAWAFAPHWNGLLKFADYQADSFATDVQKTWLSVEYVY